MSVSCVEQECRSSKHPEPSTLSFQIYLWHQGARKDECSIFCEKARMHSISICTDVKMQGNQSTKRTEVRGSRSVEHHRIYTKYITNALCQSTTFHNQKNCTTRPKFKTQSAKTSLIWTFQNMSASCVKQECGSSINHPEPSTLIVKLFHWHQSAREYKSSIICEKARVYSISI